MPVSFVLNLTADADADLADNVINALRAQIGASDFTNKNVNSRTFKWAFGTYSRKRMQEKQVMAGARKVFKQFGCSDRVKKEGKRTGLSFCYGSLRVLVPADMVAKGRAAKVALMPIHAAPARTQAQYRAEAKALCKKLLHRSVEYTVHAEDNFPGHFYALVKVLKSEKMRFNIDTRLGVLTRVTMTHRPVVSAPSLKALKAKFNFVPASDESVDDEYELIKNPNISVQITRVGSKPYTLNEWLPAKRAQKTRGGYATLNDALAKAVSIG